MSGRPARDRKAPQQELFPSAHPFNFDRARAGYGRNPSDASSAVPRCHRSGELKPLLGLLVRPPVRAEGETPNRSRYAGLTISNEPSADVSAGMPAKRQCGAHKREVRADDERLVATGDCVLLDENDRRHDQARGQSRGCKPQAARSAIEVPR